MWPLSVQLGFSCKAERLNMMNIIVIMHIVEDTEDIKVSVFEPAMLLVKRIELISDNDNVGVTLTFALKTHHL